MQIGVNIVGYFSIWEMLLFNSEQILCSAKMEKYTITNLLLLFKRVIERKFGQILKYEFATQNLQIASYYCVDH